MRASMPVAVTGDAGKLLVITEAAKGRTGTSSEDARAELEAAGASWEATPVVVESSLVTANGVEGVREAMDRFIEVVAAYERETDAKAACRRMGVAAAGPLFDTTRNDADGPVGVDRKRAGKVKSSR